MSSETIIKWIFWPGQLVSAKHNEKCQTHKVFTPAMPHLPPYTVKLKLIFKHFLPS